MVVREMVELLGVVGCRWWGVVGLWGWGSGADGARRGRGDGRSILFFSGEWRRTADRVRSSFSANSWRGRDGPTLEDEWELINYNKHTHKHQTLVYTKYTQTTSNVRHCLLTPTHCKYQHSQRYIVFK